MGFLPTLRIAGSALTAQRLRMDIIAANVANAETTRTQDGGPYERKQVVFAPLLPDQPVSLQRAQDSLPQGVQVVAINEDAAGIRLVHEPDHPDADANGYVAYPNIDMVVEMTDMVTATRAYEASVTVINAAKSMALKALEIGRS